MVLFGRVASDKELQKQKQVASVHDKGGRVVFRIQIRTRLSRIGVVHVKAGQCHGHAHGHLADLKGGNEDGIEFQRVFQKVFAPGHGHDAVIAVHARVDGVIHHDKENAGRRFGRVRVPAVEQDCHVMVPVQKEERFLVNDNKEGIEQFGEFGQNEQLDPEAGAAAAKGRARIEAERVAHRVM